jgi:hypothetical protein
MADRAKLESRIKRLSRGLDNAHILEAIDFLPYAEVLLHHSDAFCFRSWIVNV